nr:Ig-like domain-containing protein [Kofleriaceae bacterium]
MGNSVVRGLRAFATAAVAIACACSNTNQFPNGGGGGGGDGGGGSGKDASVPADARPDSAVFGDAEPIDATSNQVPQITIISPAIGELVAGTIPVHFQVNDLDGVKSVAATIAGTSPITLTSSGSDWFGTFDTKTLVGLVSPTIVIRAISGAEIEGDLGYEITLDNSPPLSSLDPQDVRLGKLDPEAPTGLDCSQHFDPVGGDAPNDNDTVPQLVEFRARVEDLSNTGTVDTTLFIERAGVKTVQLYVLDDTTQPLVVDTDGDGICDDINPDIVPTTVPMLSDEAAVVDLQAVTATTTAFFPPGLSFGSHGGECSSSDDTAQPVQMCPGEPRRDGPFSTTAVINQSFTAVPEIYGIPQVDTFNCMGYAMDLKATNISDGPACAAILAIDNLGNRMVSAPLRVCVDKDQTGKVTCTPANCTGSVSGGTVNSTACTPRDFNTTGRTGGNDFEVIQPAQ